MNTTARVSRDRRILVIGSGGREHAICLSLATNDGPQEMHVPISSNARASRLFACPGNPGISKLATLVPNLNPENPEAFPTILDFVKSNKIELVVIGPEGPLVAGLSDYLRNHGVLVFGPSQLGARLEGSKIFAKEFMKRAQVPTAPAQTCTSVLEVMAAAKGFKPPYVIKADGLAAGKGVVLCDTLEELEGVAQSFLNLKTLGSAGQTVLLEQFLPGWELSCLVLTNGREYQILPLAQDHKRLLDENKGPNTGGMGTFAPLSIDPHLLQQIEKEIVQPSIQQLDKEKILFRGVLFIGIMVTPNGPSVLEFNCRFGDPEAQVILPLLENNMSELLFSIADGTVPELQLKKNLSTCCVVLASPGYPDSPQKGLGISGDPFAQTKDSYFIHAGTSVGSHSMLVTNGGRVLGAVGLGIDHTKAKKAAYALIESVRWEGLHYRKDIGPRIYQLNRSVR